MKVKKIQGNFSRFEFDTMVLFMDFPTNGLADQTKVTVKKFYSGINTGYGNFVFNSTGNKNTHNGGTIIDPTHTVIPGAAGWWTSQNSTADGVWERSITDPVNPEWFGLLTSPADGTPPLQAAIDFAEGSRIEVPFNASGYKSDKLTLVDGGSLNISFNKSSFSPFSVGIIRLFDLFQATFNELFFTGINATGYERVFQIRSDSVVKCLINHNVTRDCAQPVRVFCDDVGVTEVNNNDFSDVISVVDGEVLNAITVGKDTETLGTVYAYKNVIKNVDYTFSLAGGIDVHGIQCQCATVFITDNEIDTIKSTASVGNTGTEAIYTKALTQYVEGNTIIDGGSEEGAITIKGAPVPDSDQTGTVSHNRIFYRSGYVPIQAGIKVFRDNIDISDNIIKGSTDVGIVTSVSNTGDISTTINNNQVIGCRARYSYQFSHNGITASGNKIIKPVLGALEWGAIRIKDFSAGPNDMAVSITDTTIIVDDGLTTVTDSGLFVVDGTNDVKNVAINGVTFIDLRTSKPTRIFMLKGAGFTAGLRLDWDNVSGFVPVDSDIGADLFNTHGNVPFWDGFPTVGVYLLGERGFYKDDTKAPNFLGWICTTGGTAGSGAVFKNFGAIV